MAEKRQLAVSEFEALRIRYCIWRSQGGIGAIEAVRGALLQEHFTATLKEWREIHLMTGSASGGHASDEKGNDRHPFGGPLHLPVVA